jgi:hypothetical protein
MHQKGGQAMNIEEKLKSPKWIFTVYMLAASAVVVVFRAIFPDSPSPLLLFSRDWRMLQGFLEWFEWFPAIAFSALVVPFGLASYEEDAKSFSQVLFKRLMPSLIIAICAAIAYAIIFFFALPMLTNKEENMRFKGRVYNLAKEQAQLRSRAGEWVEASQFLDICYQIWPASPELASMKNDIENKRDEMLSVEGLERARARAALTNGGITSMRAELTPASGEAQPLTPAQAISMSEKAFKERRYFDAHWLAAIGERISVRGSPEAAAAARLASDAWNAISSLAPNRREERLHSLYELKLSGYQAMHAGDWVTAYYIFLELTGLTPDDPDVKNYLALSEKGMLEYVFFIDEMELSLGQILTGAVYSLPSKRGRSVVRFSNLSTSADIAYGIGFEYMEFDLMSRPIVSLRAPYVKLLPVTLDNKPQIMVITHAVSRYDKNLSWECEWLLGDKTMAGIVIDVTYEDFLLISEVRGGLANLQVNELYEASRKLGNAGYISQIFEAEILNRMGTVAFFMPMAIFAIVIGWRYRARKKPRYFFVLLLPVLPIVFHGFVFLYRSILNYAGIWLVLSLGFSVAITIFIVFLVLTLFISMIVLAAQHG